MPKTPLTSSLVHAHSAIDRQQDTPLRKMNTSFAFVAVAALAFASFVNVLGAQATPTPSNENGRKLAVEDLSKYPNVPDVPEF